MNPLCGRCNRVVYPTEKVNCLDKESPPAGYQKECKFKSKTKEEKRCNVFMYWHKGCFNCEVCHMTLNMKNYKGFEKRPYCNAHYPKTQFTAVADTPENIRLKQQSMIQSQVLYKENFEKSKGRGYSVVADTPEYKRAKITQDQISNVKYHEDFEKRKMGGDASQQQQPPPSRPSQASQMQQSAVSQNYHCDPAPAPVQLAAATPAPVQPAAPASAGKRYRAVYDYSAADEDEVSFIDGDVIIEVQQIDEGWMYGRVKRTGQQGMLPSNYVEAIPE